MSTNQNINGSGQRVENIAVNYNTSIRALVDANPWIEYYRLSGVALPDNSWVYIPSGTNGGLDYSPSTYYNNQTYIGSKYHSVGTNIENSQCYFIRYSDSEKLKEDAVWALPVYPIEFNDTNSASFNSTSVLGRSVSYQTYNNSSRSVSFNLTLHEELVRYNYEYVHDLVAAIESANYPEYGENGIVKPPEVGFIIGDQFKIKGILTQCSASWQAPIIDGKLVMCTLSLGVTETTGPYSMNDVFQYKGNRGDVSIK